MGCAASNNAAHVTPTFEGSGVLEDLDSSGEFEFASSLWNRPRLENVELGERSESAESEKMSSGNSSVSFRMWNMNRQAEAEQIAAGWPAWLSNVAGEAIHGWVPLKADSFQKLEKIGQGTYSSVFRAREVDTGRIVALKKVRFNNFEPESVRFMAREIQMLRKLDHPNIIKLEGLITSRLSCSMYLVFEYMEHDLAGLSSCPDIKLTDPQIKCYMHQLLSGLEHCHSHSIIHRDIKCANLLVNNEGILKIADFGLANTWNPGTNQSLTTRVMTLWYRAPELLLGSTNYEPSVDLWSIGCVLAELFLGKPLLQGRTEVEQLHKIFKLCGSPPDEFWRNSDLPHATVFKPQQLYVNCIKETFECLPDVALRLLETFLSIVPNKRGSASSALSSEYFRTQPYACEPSSLPKYEPNKEIDRKFREQSCRGSISSRLHLERKKKSSAQQSSSRGSNSLFKTAKRKERSTNAQGMNRGSTKQEIPVVNGGTQLLVDSQLMSNNTSQDEGWKIKQTSTKLPFSGPIHGSNSFAWTKKTKGQTNMKSLTKSISRQDKSGTLDPSNISKTGIFKLTNAASGDLGSALNSNLKDHKSYESMKDEMLKQWMHPEHQDPVYTFGTFHTRNLSETILHGRDTTLSQKILGGQDQGRKIELSGPLLQAQKVDEFLERHEQRIQKAIRKSWFQRGQKRGQ
ncbi:protein IMPAIRED IN BABA-INDUCED STERILITY 1-like isoform X1 [Zingiber officinale]|uniref:protein IMPAIRED IN BABA-INDUCED STERILITY 1-like isoform X1 n=1 Tax=Zingiber officinale TaxID=94328 RepID=UPI001C4DC3D9|nr:protein IMPAIRED IN BABA-INDUCED STERILITY 1-like isoform X1 [Zingiber officinale]